MKRQNMIRIATSLSVAALLGLLAISGGCGSEKASSPTQSGDSQFRIDSLGASPDFLHPGDSTYIYVRVQTRGDDPEPAVGASVQFGWIGRNASGEFFVSEALTDSLGVAYGGYQAPLTETGTINLKVVVEDEEVGYLAVDVDTGPSGPPIGTPSIQITSTESSLPANGASTTELTITVTRGGQPAAGEVVTLVAGEKFEDRDYDGVYSSGDSLVVDADNDGFWDTIGSIPGSVVTGSSGTAAATYTAGLVECSVFIKASVDSVSSDFEMLLSAGPADITLDVSPVEILADGYATAAVVAAILDGEQCPLPGRLVRFVAGEPFEDIDGDGYYTHGVDSFTDTNDNGAWDVMGQLTPSTANSNGEGLAVAVFVAGRTTGQVTIYASTQEKRGEAIISLLDLPRVVGATWSWNPESVYADGSSEAVLDLVVLDINGGTIPGKEIAFMVSAGSIDTVAVADGDGVAHATFIASETCETVTVTASAGDWSLDIPLELTPLPEVCAIHLEMEENRLFANGAGGQVWTTGLAAQCYDGDGLPIPQGVVVTFEIVSGPGGGEGFAPLGASTVTVLTNADGIASVVIASGNEAGIVEILVSSGAAERSTTLEILETVRQISFRALPPELWVFGVGMADHSVLEATCYLAHELLAPAGIEVTFVLVSGPGGGETLLDEEGSVDSLVALTDENGVARAAFRSGTVSGPLEVKAISGDAHETLRLGISSGPPTGMYCVAVPDEEEPFVWIITATVHDAYHNPAPEGTIVVFTADAGLISTASGTGTAGTIDGSAEATFTSFASSGVASILCRTDGEVSCSLDIDLSPFTEEPGPIARIMLMLSESQIAVKETGGTEQCFVIASCYDASYQPVGRDRAVEFEIVAGPGGGEELLDAGLGPVTVLTNNASQAVVALGSGTISGTVEVQATADSMSSAVSTLVAITAGPPAHISLGADPLNIRGWDVVGADASVVAYVSDIYNNPVREGTVVHFTCDEGMIRGHYVPWEQLGSSFTMGGVAEGTYFSGLPRDNGQVEITATTSGGEVVGTGGLISSGPPVYLEFISPPDSVSLAADGESTLKFWVEVLDINHNFVVAGELVDFETNIGIVTDQDETANGVTGSIAQGEYTSEVLDCDYSWTTPDDGLGGVAYVVAMAGLGGAASDVLYIRLLTTVAYRKNCEVDIESSAPAGASLPFDVTIKDRYGNPLGGHVITASASKGSVSPASRTTDMWGNASLTFTSALTDSGQVVITVTDNDPTYGGVTLSETVTLE